MYIHVATWRERKRILEIIVITDSLIYACSSLVDSPTHHIVLHRVAIGSRIEEGERERE
jgi:hypothetical protein